MNKLTLSLQCSSIQEMNEITSLIRKYREALTICFVAELGTCHQMSDGEIVKDCLLDGLRVTRKAIRLLRTSTPRER
jgi:hypothetical protein